MSMTMKKYFEEAKKRGIEPYQISYSTATETSVEVHNGNVEVQQIGTCQDISARGIVDGKKGSFATDCIDKNTPSLLAENVLESAKFGKEDKPEYYFHGGLKYKKPKTKQKDFVPSTLKDIREFALAYCEEVKNKDPRIKNVTISVSMENVMSQKFNSYGLKCKDESTLYSMSISIVAENENHEPRSGYRGVFSFFSLEDLKKKADEKLPLIISSAVDFFNSKPLESRKYKILFDSSCVGSLLAFFLAQLNAKSVQQHLSVFEGKIDTQIVSKCLTIRHAPHLLHPAASSYDADGYPTKEFTFIQNGVLKDYFYSIETALKENRESNGCASGNGNGSPILISVKPGRNDLDSLLKKVKNGLYITSISGLNSGINSQTLEFSLPCEGYLVKDGKKDKAFSMMVVAGNLKDVFSEVLAVGNDIRIEQGRTIPSMVIKSLTVSGK